MPFKTPQSDNVENSTGQIIVQIKMATFYFTMRISIQVLKTMVYSVYYNETTRYDDSTTRYDESSHLCSLQIKTIGLVCRDEVLILFYVMRNPFSLFSNDPQRQNRTIRHVLPAKIQSACVSRTV